MQQTRKPNRRERRASKVGTNPRAQVVTITTGPLKGASVIAEEKPDESPTTGLPHGAWREMQESEEVSPVPADDAAAPVDESVVETAGDVGVESPTTFGTSDEEVVTEDPDVPDEAAAQPETGYAPGTIALRAIGLMKIADRQLAADFTARSGVYQHAHFQRVAQAALIEELGYMSAQNDVVIEGLKHIVRLLSAQNEMMEKIFITDDSEMAHYQAEADEAAAAVNIDYDADAGATDAVDASAAAETETAPAEPVAVTVDIE